VLWGGRWERYAPNGVTAKPGVGWVHIQISPEIDDPEAPEEEMSSDYLMYGTPFTGRLWTLLGTLSVRCTGLIYRRHDNMVSQFIYIIIRAFMWLYTTQTPRRPCFLPREPCGHGAHGVHRKSYWGELSKVLLVELQLVASSSLFLKHEIFYTHIVTGTHQPQYRNFGLFVASRNVMLHKVHQPYSCTTFSKKARMRSANSDEQIACSMKLEERPF
jgi:hypothetical protein